MTYLGWWGQEVLPGQEEDGLCGNCNSRQRAPGDWLCSVCRQELEAEWRGCLSPPVGDRPEKLSDTVSDNLEQQEVGDGE